MRLDEIARDLENALSNIPFQSQGVRCFRSGDMADILRAYFNDQAVRRDVVIIAHSYGGLVVKKVTFPLAPDLSNPCSQTLRR